MTWWHALLLGVLQGLTEFLPVSSSGHLAVAQLIIPGFDQPGVVFDAVLHLGTAAAVIFFERREIGRWLTTRGGLRLGALLVLGTAATAAVAFPVRNVATAAFSSSVMVGACLLVTGAVVMITRLLRGGSGTEHGMRWQQAAIVGLAQGAAVFPGLSRSGMTITAGLGSGLERAWAARFSFILSIPAIAGATLMEMIGERAHLAAAGAPFWFACCIGAVAAGTSGYVALRVVLVTVSSRVFHRFAWYCLPLGLLVVLLGLGGVL